MNDSPISIHLRPELLGLTVSESESESIWAAWDDAVAKQDGIYSQHEEVEPA